MADTGLYNPGSVNPVGLSKNANTAISYGGTLLKVTAVADEVDVCGAGENPQYCAATDTKHRITGVATADVQVGCLPLINGIEIYVPLLATNAEIAIGDLVETTAGGTVDKKDGAGWIVGHALEAKAALAGATTANTIKISVDKYYAAA